MQAECCVEENTKIGQHLRVHETLPITNFTDKEQCPCTAIFCMNGFVQAHLLDPLAPDSIPGDLSATGELSKIIER